MPVVESLPRKSSPLVPPPPLFPVTVTAALWLDEPPSPSQRNANVLLELVSAPVLAVPDVALEPLQAPLAVQLLAFVDDQVSVELAPLVTDVGLAAIDTVGAGVTGTAATDVDALAEPPSPEQLKLKVVFAADSAPVLAVPDVARLPLQPPLAVQLVAFVDDQVRLELPPLGTEAGLADSCTVGLGATALTVTVTAWLAPPPGPVQANVKVLLGLVNAPVLALPEVGRLPPHAPPATQLVALVEDQLSVALLPLSTLVGFAASETVGADGGGGGLTAIVTL